MTKKIVVGFDGSTRGKRALEWAARYASQDGAELELLAVMDEQLLGALGNNPDLQANIQELLDQEVKELIQVYPSVSVSTRICCGTIVESLVDASEGCELIVVGSHHGRTVGDVLGGAKGLRVSVASTVPTAIIPSDWEPGGEGIVVGVGSDSSSDAAVDYAAELAARLGEPLRLVSVWGLPPLLSRSAEAMGGGLQPVGERFQAALDEQIERLREKHPDLTLAGIATEAPSPAAILIEESKTARALVLGTHARHALGRAVFGSIAHSVLLRLHTPTIIVPHYHS